MLRNLTLSRMEHADLATLLPDVHQRDVEVGEVLIAQGAEVETVGFLATASVVNTVTFSDGRGVEAFDMGREGVTGLAAFLAEAPCAWAVEVRGEGVLFEVPAKKLRRVVENSPAFRRQLMGLTHAYQAQASLNLACSVYHLAEARLASLLLFRGDRDPTNHLRCTHEELAIRLGLQRTTVTQAALGLKDAGAITYARGSVRIVDRPVLERLACECHAMRRTRRFG